MATARFFERQPAASWNIAALQQAVEHFAGVYPRRKAAKNELVEALGLIADEQSLTAQHGYDTWYTIRQGQVLPNKRRPLLSKNTRKIHQLLTRRQNYNDFVSTYTHTAIPPRDIARTRRNTANSPGTRSQVSKVPYVEPSNSARAHWEMLILQRMIMGIRKSKLRLTCHQN